MVIYLCTSTMISNLLHKNSVVKVFIMQVELTLIMYNVDGIFSTIDNYITIACIVCSY